MFKWLSLRRWRKFLAASMYCCMEFVLHVISLVLFSYVVACTRFCVDHFNILCLLLTSPWHFILFYSCFLSIIFCFFIWLYIFKIVFQHIRKDFISNPLERAISTGHWCIKRFSVDRKGVTQVYILVSLLF